MAQKIGLLEIDAIEESEAVGVLAVSRRSKRRALRGSDALTREELRELKRSAAYVVKTLRRAKSPVRVGKSRLALTEKGSKDTVVLQGL